MNGNERRTNRRRRRCARQGVILLLTAFLLVFLLGMVAFAVDCGTIALARTQLQAAADATAIAGVDALSGGTTAVQAAVQSIGRANTAGGAPVAIVVGSDVQLGVWNSSMATFTVLTGSAASSATAVKVTCHLCQSRGTGLKLFFAPIFGISTADVAASAIAMQGSSCGPFIGLNSVKLSGGSYTDSYDSRVGPYNTASATEHGSVCSNGNITISGQSAIINGDAHPGVGGWFNTSDGALITGSSSNLTETLVVSAVETKGAAAKNDNARIPISYVGVHPVDSQGNFNLSGGDSLTLPAGTYCFKTLTLSEGSTLTINAATYIYVTGDVDISDGSIANTTGIPGNLYLYSTGDKVKISGALPFYGVIDAPTADIKHGGGSAGMFGALIGKSLKLSGGGGFHYDQALELFLGRTQLVQ